MEYLHTTANLLLLQVACIYTVELRPPTAQSSCVAFKFGEAKAKSPKNVVVNAVSSHLGNR